jgi:hypothetical protein
MSFASPRYPRFIVYYPQRRRMTFTEYVEKAMQQAEYE